MKKKQEFDNVKFAIKCAWKNINVFLFCFKIHFCYFLIVLHRKLMQKNVHLPKKFVSWNFFKFSYYSRQQQQQQHELSLRDEMS